MPKKKENILRQEHQSQLRCLKIYKGSLNKAYAMGFKSQYIFFLQLKRITKTGGLYNYIDIMHKYGYSKSVIYQRINELEQKGLVTIKPNSRSNANCLHVVSYNRFYQFLGCEIGNEFNPNQQKHVPIYKIHDAVSKDEILEAIHFNEVEKNLKGQKSKVAKKVRTKKLEQDLTFDDGISDIKSHGLQRLRTKAQNGITLSQQGIAKLFGYRSAMTGYRISKKLEDKGLINVKRGRRRKLMSNVSKEAYYNMYLGPTYYWAEGCIYKILPNLITIPGNEESESVSTSNLKALVKSIEWQINNFEKSSDLAA